MIGPSIRSAHMCVETCIELFGFERSLFATNWPVDGLWSDYKAVVDAYRTIASGFTDAEKDALFAGNAERIYRI